MYIGDKIMHMNSKVKHLLIIRVEQSESVTSHTW